MVDRDKVDYSKLDFETMEAVLYLREQHKDDQSWRARIMNEYNIRKGKKSIDLHHMMYMES